MTPGRTDPAVGIRAATVGTRPVAAATALIGAVLLVGAAWTAIASPPLGSDAPAPALAITGIVVIDAERTVTHCNEDAADLFDVDADSVVGEPLSSLFDPDAIDLEDREPTELRRGDRTYEVRVAPVPDECKGEGKSEHGYTLVFSDEDRERELQRQRDELLLVTRLNGVIRGVNEVLVTRGTQQGILEETAELLAESDLYDAAWTVERTLVDAVPADGENPENGDRGRPSPDRTGSADADTVVEGSLADGRRALSVHDDSEGLPVGDDALDGIPEGSEGRWTTVPVVHGRTAYGSIVLFSTREDAFEGRELAVLDELGRQVGHAVNAVEKELLLVSDTVIELELAAGDDDPLAVASRIADCTLRVEGLVPVGGDGVVAYCAVEGTSIHEAFAALSRVDGIVRLRPIDDRVIECRLGDGTLAVPLREVGAQLEEVVARHGVCTVVARVSPEADVRAIVDRVQRSVPAAELQAKHRRDGTATDGIEERLPEELADRLTDRQIDTLEAAYSAGYFEWPRETTAEDLADEMGVTSPTVHNHLRKAENEVLGELLDE